MPDTKYDLSIITGVTMVSFKLPVIKVTLNGSSNSLTEGENTTLSVELSMAVAMQVTVNFEPQSKSSYTVMDS